MTALLLPGGAPDRADVAVQSFGHGEPVTVLGHGLGGTTAETRLLATGVPGTKVYLDFRGHGGSSAPGTGWDYRHLAEELRRVADHTGATRALGVSLGAGALTALLAETPDRFARLVFFLPAVLDQPRRDATRISLAAMADAIDAGDTAALLALLHAELPVGVAGRPGVDAWVALRAQTLAAGGISTALRSLRDAVPVSARGVLGAVTAPALVVAQEGDPVHLVSVARDLVAALPNATLEVFPEAALWSHRDRVRGLLADFLA